MPSRLQYCVYVLLSMCDGNLYVGFTTDLQRRLTEHFFSKEDAERREGYLTIAAKSGRIGLLMGRSVALQSHVSQRLSNLTRLWRAALQVIQPDFAAIAT